MTDKYSKKDKYGMYEISFINEFTIIPYDKVRVYDVDPWDFIIYIENGKIVKEDMVPDYKKHLGIK